MGCDIHIVVEKRFPDQPDWVGIWCSDWHPEARTRARVARRDYAFFAEVAGVRGLSDTTVYPRNLPVDVSRLAWLRYMRAPTDHHSASHLSVDDFCAAWLRANPSPAELRPEHIGWDLLGLDPDEDRHCRVVFWFDN